MRDAPSKQSSVPLGPANAPVDPIALRSTTSPSDGDVVASGEIRGRVVESETERPVPNAEVRLIGDAFVSTELTERAATDDAGRFRFSAPSSSRIRFVEVAAEGFFTQRERFADTARESLEIHLRRPSTIHGTVRDADGRVLAGALVVVRDAPSTKRPPPSDRQELDLLLHRSATTDADGIYVITHLFDRCGVECSLAGFATRVLDFDRYARSSSTRVDLILERAASLRGQVVDRAGGPVDGAHLNLRPESSDSTLITASAVSGVDGLFRFEGVGSGRLRMTVSKTGYATSTRLIDPKESPVTHVLQRPGSIAGSLPEFIGRPDGVMVHAAICAKATSSEPVGRPGMVRNAAIVNGAFEVVDVDAGDYQVAIAVEGASPLALGAVNVPDGGVAQLGELRLPGRVVLRGRALSDDGLAISGARVVVFLTDFGNLAGPGVQFFSRAVAASAGGDFEILDAPAGSLTVRAIASGWCLFDDVPIGRADAGQIMRVPDLRLVKTGSITGTVIDANGRPIPRARVITIDRRGETPEVTDDAGRFSRKNVWLGTIEVAVTSGINDRTVTRRSFRLVSPGQNLEVTVQVDSD